MQVLMTADKLKMEAHQILALLHIPELLHPFGKVFATGSYFLDVMVYPDIDLYITTIRIDQLFAIGALLAACPLVTQVVFEPTDDPVHMPHGLYLKTRLNYGDWGRPWKIDLWSLAEDVILRKMAEMDHFKRKMTPVLREQIVKYKLSILTLQKRTPMYSGYHVYKAFIDEGLTDFSEVTNYLISHGVRMEAGD